MRRLPTVLRALIGLFATIQVAAPAIVTFVDARLASASVGTSTVHVEDHTGGGCRPVHPDDCALCQLLSQSGSSCVHVPGVPSSRIVRRGVGKNRVSTVDRFAVALPRSRAPPLG